MIELTRKYSKKGVGKMMKKKEIATTIGFIAVLFLLVMLLGGCARELPLEKVTQMEELTETQDEYLLELKEESEGFPEFQSVPAPFRNEKHY